MAVVALIEPIDQTAAAAATESFTATASTASFTTTSIASVESKGHTGKKRRREDDQKDQKNQKDAKDQIDTKEYRVILIHCGDSRAIAFKALTSKQVQDNVPAQIFATVDHVAISRCFGDFLSAYDLKPQETPASFAKSPFSTSQKQRRSHPAPDVSYLTMLTGSTLVLCSDGVAGNHALKNAELDAFLSTHCHDFLLRDPGAAAGRLVEHALKRSMDNLSAIVVAVGVPDRSTVYSKHPARSPIQPFKEQRGDETCFRQVLIGPISGLDDLKATHRHAADSKLHARHAHEAWLEEMWGLTRYVETNDWFTSKDMTNRACWTCPALVVDNWSLYASHQTKADPVVPLENPEISIADVEEKQETVIHHKTVDSIDLSTPIAPQIANAIEAVMTLKSYECPLYKAAQQSVEKQWEHN